jgi:hypothetical protein
MDGQVFERTAGEELSSDATFERQQRALAHFNRERLAPGKGVEPTSSHTQCMLALEESFVCSARREVASWLIGLPADPRVFTDWFEGLKQNGPGQGDPLFPWLAKHASLAQLRWFLAQEVAGEAGFDDLVASTQIKMPVRAKLEMARNYWDEMGRGKERGMHGPMLDRLARALALQPEIETTEPEALALGNMMVALGFNRRYAFHSIGALGAVELTAPSRAVHVVSALQRLGVAPRDRQYFGLHAAIDIAHSAAWNREVIDSLVGEDPSRVLPIAEGAVLRLWCGLQCFERYRAALGVAI